MGFDLNGFRYGVTTSGRMQCTMGNCGSTYQDGTLCSLLRHDETKAVGRRFHLTHTTDSLIAQQHRIRLGLIVHFQILDTHYGSSGDDNESQHGIPP
jgi:hypothetical protein